MALAVAHERDNQALWDSFEPLARQAGVRDTVTDAIAAGTAPQGLLPKEGIWSHSATEVLRNEVRDSTWQAITLLKDILAGNHPSKRNPNLHSQEWRKTRP